MKVATRDGEVEIRLYDVVTIDEGDTVGALPEYEAVVHYVGRDMLIVWDHATDAVHAYQRDQVPHVDVISSSPRQGRRQHG